MDSTTAIDYKQLEQFGSLELLAKQIVEGFIVGLHKSPFHGFSVEFSEHRLYNKGESTKHIDWKLYARTDKLFVKKYEEETNLRCQILLDVSSSMYYPSAEKNKMLFSIYAAASLVHLLKKQRDASCLALFADKLENYFPPRSSNTHIQMMYAQLEAQMKRPAQSKTTAAAEAIHQLAEIMHRRSLVVIFSDMMDNEDSSEKLFSALQHLKYNKHEVLLFHTVDKASELDFSFSNEPRRFIDMETGHTIKAYPADVKEQYLNYITQFRKNLVLKCAQYEIDLVEADISNGFAQVLLPFLLRRRKMM
ncbi:DUF58 domain-containing protein [bacterium]|nr:DUF58 domain-containing protein [bacterium]